MAREAKKMARGAKKKEPFSIDIRRNDMVKVICGSDKDKTGRVLSVDRRNGKLLVEHVKMIKRHTRPNPAKQIKGGIAERESPIAVSNVMIVCPACGPVRIAHKVDEAGGKARRTRVCRKCGATLEAKK